MFSSKSFTISAVIPVCFNNIPLDLGAALKLCPSLKTIPYDFEGYQKVSFQLYNIVARSVCIIILRIQNLAAYILDVISNFLNFLSVFIKKKIVHFGSKRNSV